MDASYMKLESSILEEIDQKLSESGLVKISKKMYTFVKHDNPSCGGSSGGCIVGIQCSGGETRVQSLMHSGANALEKFNVGRLGINSIIPPNTFVNRCWSIITRVSSLVYRAFIHFFFINATFDFSLVYLSWFIIYLLIFLFITVSPL